MLIHVEVALGGNFQVERSVPRHQLKHVIEKPDARGNFGAAAPIEIDRQAYIGFGRGAVHARASHGHNFSRSFVLCRIAREPCRRSCAARTRCASLPRASTPKNGTPARRAARASSSTSPR